MIIAKTNKKSNLLFGCGTIDHSKSYFYVGFKIVIERNLL